MGISKDDLCQVLEQIKIILNESGVLLELDSRPSVFLAHRSDIQEQSQIAPSVLDHSDIYQPVGSLGVVREIGEGLSLLLSSKMLQSFSDCL